jgi:hypothetical protein
MNYMKLNLRLSGFTAALLLSIPGLTAQSYYKEPPPFHPHPAEKNIFRNPVMIDRFGPVGIGIDLTLPAFGMKLKNIEIGSPAEATGKLKPGQIIDSINGVTLKDIDPRIILGGIITKAEATDGVIKLKVREDATSAVQEVVVKIPVLGTYSKTWPLKCAKSDKIVRGVADYLAKSGNHAWTGQDLGLLFMLSTGEEKDLEVARGWVKEALAKNKDADIAATQHAWNTSYTSLGFCEYYLRTGDASVLPLIEQFAESAKRTMYNGAWTQRGGVPWTYAGGGHINAVGVHMVTLLLLAKECGVKVDEPTLQTSLRHFFRYAGHGNVPYGDHQMEGGFVDNGKVGALAFQMAAAASLTPEGEKSVYAAARDVSAVKGFYSTSWMLHGHTGGGIGEIWRSASMGLMYDKKPTKYREFMDNRMWFYELSRRFDGSFGILGGDMSGNGSGRYDTPLWGTGLALSYTVPRKTLRMTGGPPTKFCKSYQLPKRPWGTAADDAFSSLPPASDRNGKLQDVDEEKLMTDASLPIITRLGEKGVSDDVLLQYARHPDQGVRELAASAICRDNRDNLVVELLKDKDPRARQAGTMVIYNTFKRKPMPPERITDEMVKLLSDMINDPNESWWVVKNAMLCLGMVKPEQIAPHIDRLVYWVKQDDWWLSTASMNVLSKIVADERYSGKILPAVGEMVSKNTRWGPDPWPVDDMVNQLKGSKPEMQQLSAKILAKAYTDLSILNPTVPGGIDQSVIMEWNLKRIEQELLQLPGGAEIVEKLSPAKESAPAAEKTPAVVPTPTAETKVGTGGMRDWTNVEGKTIRAEGLSSNKTTVKLKLENGKVVDYPLEKLSESSRKLVFETLKSE